MKWEKEKLVYNLEEEILSKFSLKLIKVKYRIWVLNVKELNTENNIKKNYLLCLMDFKLKIKKKIKKN